MGVRVGGRRARHEQGTGVFFQKWFMRVPCSFRKFRVFRFRVYRVRGYGFTSFFLGLSGSGFRVLDSYGFIEFWGSGFSLGFSEIYPSNLF